MYRYLDRPVRALAPATRLLVWSMRSWVTAMANGRCPCSVLGPAFASWRISGLLADFNIAMLVLNGEGLGPLRFAPVPCGEVRDDEARLLALFDAAAAEDEARVRRLASQLVQQEAVPHLTTAVGRATAMLAVAPARWDAPDAQER